jgi:hypothetical protein
MLSDSQPAHMRTLVLTAAVLTLCVQGFGDISPKSAFARVVVMAVLLCSFVIIPYEVTRLVEAFHRMPKHRAGYKFVGKKLHVVIAVSAGMCVLLKLSRVIVLCSEQRAVFSQSVPRVGAAAYTITVCAHLCVTEQ